jgi:spermidine/putrescine transport system substrate-binding protein
LVHRQLTRRQFLGRGGAAIGGLALGPALLAACGDDGGETSSSGNGGAKELFFENWPSYIDDETVGLFEEATGISMRYTDAYNDNNEYFAKIQPLLSEGRTIDPDIIAPTGWLAGRLIQLGWVDKLPLDRVPNTSNLRDDLRNPPWDPTGEYTMPWQSGIAGIAYNRQAAGRDLASTMDLFDPAFKGKVGMLLEMRDTMGLLMQATGADPVNPSFDEAADAFELLEEAVDGGQVRAFTGNDYQDDLVAGNFVVCVAWSGDVSQLVVENENLRFFVPEEGGMSFADTMVMPKGTDNVDSVAEWIDFVYDPANAARIAAYIGYISPVKGVAEELTKLGGDAAALVDNPLVFPTPEMLSQVKGFGQLSEEEEAMFDAEFSRLAGV